MDSLGWSRLTVGQCNCFAPEVTEFGTNMRSIVKRVPAMGELPQLQTYPN